jgi:flagellar motor protein MotB
LVEANVKISSERAHEVFFRLRDAIRDETERRWLEDSFVVAGRGFSAPKIRNDQSSIENIRVVIKVRGDLNLHTNLDAKTP